MPELDDETEEEIDKIHRDAYFSESPLLLALLEKQGMRLDGGDRIVLPMNYDDPWSRWTEKRR